VKPLAFPAAAIADQPGPSHSQDRQAFEAVKIGFYRCEHWSDGGSMEEAIRRLAYSWGCLLVAILLLVLLWLLLR